MCALLYQAPQIGEGRCRKWAAEPVPGRALEEARAGEASARASSIACKSSMEGPRGGAGLTGRLPKLGNQQREVQDLAGGKLSPGGMSSRR